MTIARIITNALMHISAKDKNNALKGGTSGFIFGGIAGIMASHPTTPKRCEIIFNSACIGGFVGMGTAPLSTRVLNAAAKLQKFEYRSPSVLHNHHVNTLFTLWASKVTGFTTAHLYAKKTTRQNEEKIVRKNSY